MKLSIVVPCHNEAKNIPFILEKFLALSRMRSFELIVVNNASTDNTQEVLEEFLAQKQYEFLRVLKEPLPGYGRAIVAGLRKATGELLAWTHADLQTDPADVVRGAEILERAPEPDRVIVKGKRIHRPFGAWLFTFGMSVISSLVLRGFYFDINAQPKIFSRKFFLQAMKSPPEDFSLDLYLLAVAKQKKYRILTFPVIFANRRHGTSTWNFSFSSRWKTIARTLKYIFQLRKKLRRVGPAEALSSPGREKN